MGILLDVISIIMDYGLNHYQNLNKNFPIPVAFLVGKLCLNRVRAESICMRLGGGGVGKELRLSGAELNLCRISELVAD